MAGLLAPAAPAPASAIRHASKSKATVNIAGVDSSWDSYYTRAIRQQLTNVRIPEATRTLKALSVRGLLPDMPLVQYLRWRRSLNILRFDRTHPQIGQILKRDDLIRTVVTPSTPTHPPKIDNQIITNPDVPPHVPEPGTGLIALALAAAGFWWRKRAR